MHMLPLEVDIEKKLLIQLCKFSCDINKVFTNRTYAQSIIEVSV